jgi:hypothetical protein
MQRIFFFLAAAVGMVAVAAAQAPTTKPVPPGRVPSDLVPPLKVERPDTTLLDDTKASGLKPRRKDKALPEARHGSSPPVGKQVIVRTEQGEQYAGRLELADEWFVIRLNNEEGRMWVPARYVVSIHEIATEKAEQRDEKPDRNEGAANEMLQRLRDEADRLRAELAATRDKLAAALSEAADAETQRDVAEQVRQRAEEARRAAEAELQKILGRLQRPKEEAPPK